jgi:hypothetical protein
VSTAGHCRHRYWTAISEPGVNAPL